MNTFKKFTVVILCLVIAFLFVACGKETYDAEFIGIQWTRTTEFDTEYLSFGSDGSFSYYCACGEPVNDSDLIESYSYDKEKEIITFDTIEKTDSMVTEVKIVAYDNKHLKLDFDGNIREFVVESE